MPIFLLFFGIIFLVAAIRGQDQIDKLTALLKDDFSGPNNFLIWALAIGSVAAIGYVKQLRQFSDMFLVLIFIVLVLKKRGPNGDSIVASFYSQISSQ